MDIIDMTMAETKAHVLMTIHAIVFAFIVIRSCVVDIAMIMPVAYMFSIVFFSETHAPATSHL